MLPDLELCTRSERLAELAEPWSDLANRCPTATPFQRPEWLIPWWECLGRRPHTQLRLGLLWNGSQLAGLVPTFRRTLVPGFPIVTWLGRTVSDYGDLLLDPQFAEEAEPLLDGWLAEELSNGATLELTGIRPDSWFESWTTRQRAPLERVPEGPCPLLPLDPNDPLSAVPARLRKNLRYYRRRLARFQDAEIRQASAREVEAALEVFFRLHAQRWRRRGLPGVFVGERLRRFHGRSAQEMARSGWLRLYTLTIGPAAIGSLYCFSDRRTTWYYGCGFDTDYGHLSPGTLLIGHALESAAQEGCRTFDFLRGAERYKLRWGAQAMELTTLLVAESPGSPTLMSLALAHQVGGWVKHVANTWATRSR